MTPGLMLALTGICLSSCASRILVRSEPSGAEVFVVAPENGEKKKLGKTPLEMTSDEVAAVAGQTTGKSSLVELAIELPGYHSGRYLLPAARFGTLSGTLTVKLASEQSADPGSAVGVTRKVLQKLHKAQRHARQGEFERAQIEIDEILTIDPKLPTALSLRGSIYYVQKKYDESLKWYVEALRTDPGLDDAIRMIAEVERVRKGEKARSMASILKDPAGDEKKPAPSEQVGGKSQ